MQCLVCSKVLDKGYLCKEHSQELKRMLDKKVGVVETPDFKHHCSICGEFEKRIIIEYPSVGYFCNIDIEEENERYSL